MNKIFKWVAVFVFCSSLCVGLLVKAEVKTPAPRIVNIINFIRNVEPRDSAITEDVLYQTVAEQVQILKAHQLRGTFLLQYDALINPRYQQLLTKDVYPGTEIGGWWEITEPHVKAAGLKWRGRFPWDWHANVGFATGYTPAEREKLVDVYMAKFKEIFGKYPTSIGSWFIDAHTLAYMADKYHIVASCNCKDQVGTDGYTMWGGYWNQAYYPSRKNAYMPAQTEQGQIPVPVFRMLGSDPIYQYDSGLGGSMQSVVSLEPVYKEGGGSQKWVEWLFKSLFDEPCLAFGYTQVGQENSFTWNAMKQGFEIQIPLLDKLLKEKKIQVATLSEAGTWFKMQFPVTPATAVTTLTDFRNSGKKTVWYNSRYYRANLLWDGSSFRFRDIHLFDEGYLSDYLYRAGTSTQCVYTTLPFVDGCLWSSAKQLAGLRLKYKDASGKMVEAKGGTPTVIEQGKNLLVRWPLTNKAKLSITFMEDRMLVACPGAANWQLELTTLPEAKLPFTSITAQKAEAMQKSFSYQIVCTRGRFVDTRSQGQGNVLRIEPTNGQVVLSFKQSK
jgi:hypothetical protein